MGTRALPDIYAFSPRASGIHIRQSTHAHVITLSTKPKLCIRTYALAILR